MKDTPKFRTRYAPSPTGHLHLGNARTAIFSYLLAKHYNGDFIIRVEDTDTNRNVKEGVSSQIDYLSWLGIDYDEGPFKENNKYGPYYQSQRKGAYNHYLLKLIQLGLAYPCFCTPKELETQREQQQKAGHKAPMYDRRCLKLSKDRVNELSKTIKPVYRFFVNGKGKDISWLDLVRGKISFERTNIEDFVIVKQNGMPTYNFANVVDDIEMAISHVVRGEEHISNTPKQILLYESFKKLPPHFGHLPIIINKKGKKLSKRDTEAMQFISDYKEAGLFPEAVLNYLTLLGWSPKEEREIFTKKELADRFDFDRISRAPSQYDITKLFWFNKEYMNLLSIEEKNKLRKDLFCKKCTENVVIQGHKVCILDFVSRVIDMNEWTLSDHKKVTREAFNYVLDSLENESEEKWLQHIEKSLLTLPIKKIEESIVIDSNIKELEQKIKLLLKEVREQFAVGGRTFFQGLRMRFSSKEQGPEIWRILLLYSVLVKR